MFEFKPQVGMKTDNCFLHGINWTSDIYDIGVIEHVGVDYFILRNIDKDKPLFITEDQYNNIEEKDFN